MDWFKLGKDLGQRGETDQEFAESREACSKHSIRADQEAYAKGRVAGLQTFCTQERGYTYGLAGEDYEKVCPKKLEMDFLKGYDLGRKEYEIKKREAELKKREQELKKKENEIKAKKLAESRFGTKTCKFSSDCRIDGRCSLKKCQGSNQACNFDSDCKIEGRCSSESVVADGSVVRVDVCKY